MTRSGAITTIGNPVLSAGFLVDEGMLGVSLKHRGHELVALPNSVEAYQAGKLTGIPLMHPWANRLRSHIYRVANRTVQLPVSVPADGNGLPMHGVMHGRKFVVRAHSQHKLDAQFEFIDDTLLDVFPFPHRITVTAEIQPSGSANANALTITTAITNLGESAMPISFGWHPYLVASAAPRNTWRLRMPACTRHVLDEQLLPTGMVTQIPVFDEAIGTTTFDDHYQLGADRRFAISTAETTIDIEFDDGFAHAQVYVPPDRGDDQRNFVCIEPMTAPSNALGDGVAPMLDVAATFSAAFTITVT